MSPTVAPSYKIAVVNQSTRVSDAQASTMVDAVHRQVVYHFDPAWNLGAGTIAFYPQGKTPPADAWPIVLLDNSDQAGALGYHATTPDGKPYGRVFAGPVLDHHGGVLDGGSIGVSVASVLSHEALETIADWDANDWSQAPDGRLWAREVGDPVESWGYTLTASDGTAVLVSDFVFPAFFDPGAPGPYDHNRQLTTGFSLGKGGYAIVMAGGNVTQIFGDAHPAAWRQETKRFAASRTARRLKATVSGPHRS